MALPISIISTTGGTLYATLIRQSDGFRWSVLATAWEASPTYANSKITLTEDSAEYAGRYRASVTGLGDAGDITVEIHDGTDADSMRVEIPTRVMGGDEVATDNSLGLTEDQVDAMGFLLDELIRGAVVADAGNTGQVFLTTFTAANGVPDLGGQVVMFGADATALNARQKRRVIVGGHNRTTGQIRVDVAFSAVPVADDPLGVTGYQSSTA